MKINIISMDIQREVRMSHKRNLCFHKIADKIEKKAVVLFDIVFAKTHFK